MPIVGIFNWLVILFDSFVSTHSNTIEKTPAFSRSLVSFKILSLALNFLPLKVNFLSVWGKIPTWPITGILFLIKFLTIGIIFLPPSSFTPSHLVFFITNFTFFKASFGFRYVLYGISTIIIDFFTPSLTLLEWLIIVSKVTSLVDL